MTASADGSHRQTLKPLGGTNLRVETIMSFLQLTRTLVPRHISPLSLSPGPPEPVRDCRTGEPDPFIVHVVCLPGYDGGLEASFTLELYTEETQDQQSLQSTVTNSLPTFSVYNLPPGTRFR